MPRDLSNGSADTPRKTRPSLRQRILAIWSKTGITWKLYKLMFKGALAPTLCVAIYQADSVAALLTSLGYLVAIVSILGIVIRPRATFLQSLLLNLLFTCTSMAVLILSMYCSVKARQYSQTSTDSSTSGIASTGVFTAPYNSSAAAVTGVWLFFMVYVLAIFRAFGKKYMIAAIHGSIVVNVGSVYGAQMGSMDAALSFAWSMLQAFLIGMGIATGVNLFIFPTSNRTVIFDDIRQYAAAITKALQADIAYIQSLEEGDMFTRQSSGTKQQTSSQGDAARSAMRSLTAIFTKFQADLPFAKREVGYSYLGADDLQDLSRHMRMVTMPMIGLSSLPNIFDRSAEDNAWDQTTANGASDVEKSKLQAIQEWHSITKLICGPFQDTADLIESGIQHALITLKIVPGVRISDPESHQQPAAGSAGFLEYFSTSLFDSKNRRSSILAGWAKVHDIDVEPGFFEHPEAMETKLDDCLNVESGPEENRRMRKQLYLLLFMEYYLRSVGRRVEDLMLFADGIKSHGKLNKRHVIFPGWKRVYKWFMSTFSSADDEQQGKTDEGVNESVSIRVGEALRYRKDPLHLPPRNRWERFGNRLRSAATFMRSQPSVFGFRVACATLSLAILAFLQQTQAFYTTQRLFWAQMMIAFGMQPTTSESQKTSLFRILGTAIFLFVAWIVWYIVDGQPAGVIVFYFIFVHLGPWIIIKHPKYTTLGMIGPITLTLICGYELQVLKIGVQEATANGQAFYPVYELGPIRLATVVGGLFVGWIWTILPYPFTEHHQQKTALGQTLYTLAQYYSATDETVRLRLKGLDSDERIRGSASKLLAKDRRKLFTSCNVLLAGIETRAAAMDFDIQIGGKFPRQQYDKITEILQSMLNFMALISYSSTAFTDLKDASEAANSSSEWLSTFRRLIANTSTTSQGFTTLLSLMAASVSNGQPLPPYLKAPEAFQLAEQLDAIDKDVLSIRHVLEPGYSSFAVIQIALKYLHDDLKRLLPAIKELVGELDFSLELESQEQAYAEKQTDV